MFPVAHPPAGWPHALRLVAALAVVLGVAAWASACGSDARAVDACRKLEAARCERAKECNRDFVGDAQSCTRFYEVQCGRGVHDHVKEPLAAELEACLAAIRDKSSCAAALDPSKSPSCSFLAPPPPPPPDTGTPEVASDAPAEGG